MNSSNQPSKTRHHATHHDSHAETDVSKLHEPIIREHREPREGLQPMPLWLILLFGIVIFWGGGYMMYYSGGFRPDIFDETQINFEPPQPIGPPPVIDPKVRGKLVYNRVCASCHQTSGTGAGGWPPLAGSEWVTGPAARPIMIVLNGLTGPITVKGEEFGSIAMPSQKDSLNDSDIAAILTYIRSTWGNNAPPVTPEMVKAWREKSGNREALTAEELSALQDQ